MDSDPELRIPLNYKHIRKLFPNTLNTSTAFSGSATEWMHQLADEFYYGWIEMDTPLFGGELCNQVCTPLRSISEHTDLKEQPQVYAMLPPWAMSLG